MLYFAYRSNLNPEQMRLRCPSHKVVGMAALREHRLAFPLTSHDWGGGVASLVPAHGTNAWGIVYELSDEDLSKTSLIGAIERHLNVPIKFMEQTVDAALAPRSVAELLQLRPRSPLLLFQRTYFVASGEPVNYAITYQTGRRYPYRVGLSRSERRG